MNGILSAQLRAIRNRLSVIFVLTLGFAASNLSADIKLDLLKTAGGCYSNVTIFNRTSTHLSFAHANGVAVIKLAEVDAESLAAINGSNSAATAAGSVVMDGKKRVTPGENYLPIADKARLHSFTSALASNPMLQNALHDVSRNFI